MPKWTPEKLKALRERYSEEDSGLLAQELGFSRKALNYRAHSEGLKKSDKAREAAYAKLGRPALPEGARREIATGIVIVAGRTTVHLSHAGAGA